MCWGLKFLTLSPDAQSRLRTELQAHFKSASREKRAPTAQEIATADIPYFEAVIEEIHRCGHTAPAMVRRTTCDTTILGYPVPKGTDVFLVSNTWSASHFK